MKEKETLYPFSHLSTHLPLRITLTGVTHPHTDYEVRRKKSTLTVVEYVLSGKGFLEIDGEQKEVHGGQIYLLRQGMPHFYGADSKEPYEKIFINAAGSFLEEMLDRFGLTSGVYEDPGLKEAFLQIPRLIASGKEISRVQTSLLGLLMQILSTLALAKKETGIDAEAARLRQYLDQNLNRIVSARELGEVIFRSPDYCRKLFSRAFGTTPYAYQLEQKIRRAKVLLIQTNLSVGEIAAFLGYEDLHYFSNLFLQKTGKRPLALRKEREEA